MKVYSKIYLMIDTHGNKTSAVVEDASDTTQVCGMFDKKGEPTYFESEAYHISTFCEKHGIHLKIIEREEDFDILWNGKEIIYDNKK